MARATLTPMSTLLDRLTPALADRYEILAPVGSGGMASVYRARDLRHDREVALKVLRADLRDARAYARQREFVAAVAG